MSYCRWGPESDVYVYATTYVDRDNKGRVVPLWVCHGCSITGEELQPFRSLADTYEHLLEHRRQGHEVPDSALDRLAREMKEAQD